MAYRVLLAGLFHETHSFLEGRTTLSDFTERRGDELFSARGDGSPLAGAIQIADECGWSLIPSIDLRATPSATVEDAVVDRFWSEFVATVKSEEHHGFDGVYLVLHGAMVSESLSDVEGELIRRIREIPVLQSVPVCGVLDLHGNISPKTIELTQGFVAYRHNPHTDACEAAADGARLLDRILRTRQTPRGVCRQPPVLWPPTGTGTADDPMKSLEQMARQIEHDHPELLVVNVFGGFSFSDTFHTGPSFSAYTLGSPTAAMASLQPLMDYCRDHWQQGCPINPTLDEVWPQIFAKIQSGETPIVIVEPSDNIGGGAPGDGTSVLRFLMDKGIENSAVVIDDAAAVQYLREVEIGQSVRLTLGGRGSRLTEGPLTLDVELSSRSHGKFELEDRHSHLASMCGVNIDMGDCAVVRIGSIQVLLTSRKTPPFDLGQLRSQGIIPEHQTIIGVKAAVAHRQAYCPIQKASFTVSTPGPCSSDARTFPFQNVRHPILPLDAVASFVDEPAPPID